MRNPLILKKWQEINALYKWEAGIGLLALFAVLAISGGAFRQAPYNVGLGVSLVLTIAGLMHFVELRRS